MGISRQRFNINLRELFDMRLIAKVGKRNKANVYAIAEEDYLYDFANHGVPAARRSVDGKRWTAYEVSNALDTDKEVKDLKGKGK